MVVRLGYVTLPKVTVPLSLESRLDSADTSITADTNQESHSLIEAETQIDIFLEKRSEENVLPGFTVSSKSLRTFHDYLINEGFKAIPGNLLEDGSYRLELNSAIYLRSKKDEDTGEVNDELVKIQIKPSDMGEWFLYGLSKMNRWYSAYENARCLMEKKEKNYGRVAITVVGSDMVIANGRYLTAAKKIMNLEATLRHKVITPKHSTFYLEPTPQMAPR